VQLAPTASDAGQAVVSANAPVTAKAVSESAFEPVFVTLIACAALVVPTSWEVNVRAAGLSVMALDAEVPVPLRATVALGVGLVLVIVSAPITAPAAVGVKVTLTVQDAPAASVEEQVVVSAKGPVTAKAVREIALAPGLVTVTFWAALLIATTCEVNVSEAGVIVIPPADETPVPLSATEGEVPVLLRIVREPALAPAAVGAKATFTMHEAPAARVAGQPVDSAKEPVIL
jgi:hypothetical protein